MLDDKMFSGSNNEAFIAGVVAQAITEHQTDQTETVLVNTTSVMKFEPESSTSSLRSSTMPLLQDAQHIERWAWLPWRQPGWTCSRLERRYGLLDWNYACERDNIHKRFILLDDMVLFIRNHPRPNMISANVRGLDTSSTCKSKKRIVLVDRTAPSSSTAAFVIHTRVQDKSVPLPRQKSTATPT
jgi:hypothetical protein